MATTTTNLGLTKPDAAEGYDINVFNSNADTLDQFAGEMRNMLGGDGGGLGEKVDALQEGMTAARSEIAAVKADTSALVQALATANANIATLLTQNGSVKAIVTGSYNTSPTGTDTVPIPATMNPDKVIILINYWPSSTTHLGVSFVKTEDSFKISAGVGLVTYQLVEFY